MGNFSKSNSDNNRNHFSIALIKAGVVGVLVVAGCVAASTIIIELIKDKKIKRWHEK